MIAAEHDVASWGSEAAVAASERWTVRSSAVRPTTGRIDCVDAARGVAVVAMLAANLVNVFFEDIPPVLAHNQGNSLRFFDLPAPAFQLLVGVSLPLFLASRAKAGRSAAEARRDAMRRYAMLVLLGIALDCAGRLTLVPQWGVLQTLGLGGMVATLLATASDRTVVAVSLALLAVFVTGSSGEVHGGPFAAFAFVPLTLLGLVVGRALGRMPRRAFAIWSTWVAAAAFASALALFHAGIRFNKIHGSSSFVLLAAAASTALLAVAATGDEAQHGHPRWLLLVGRNALTAWVMLYVLVYYPAWIVVPSWGRLALAPGAVAVATTTAAICMTTVRLGRRGIRVPL